MIELVLPTAVVAVETFEDRPGEPVFPGEETLVARAVEQRRREVVTARRCAREALAVLGRPATVIHRGPRGEPVWPSGVIGSITHCAGYRAAAVARAGDLASVGIDAEPHHPLPEGIDEVVTLPGEHTMLRRLAIASPTLHWDRLLFSAKEAVFKAWHPLTRRELDFTEAELEFDPVARSFVARLRPDGSRIDGGPPLTELTGRYLVARDVIVTAVHVPR